MKKVIVLASLALLLGGELLRTIEWEAAEGPRSYTIAVQQRGQYDISVTHYGEKDGTPVEASESATFNIQAMRITVIDIVPGAIGVINVEGPESEPQEFDPKSEGTPSNPVTLTVGVMNSGSVGSYGTSFYRFTTTVEGSYTIALTDTQSDLGWDLYRPAPDYDWMMECDDYWHAADEIATTPVLLASTTYHLTVDEWDWVAGRFKLLITPR